MSVSCLSVCLADGFGFAALAGLGGGAGLASLADLAGLAGLVGSLDVSSFEGFDFNSAST